MLYKLTGIILLIACLNSNSNDDKYVWATKLNMRKSPAINGQIIKQLKQGDKIKILEITDLKFEVTDTLFVHLSTFDKTTRRYIEERKPYPKTFSGKWVKISAENQIGYVFGFYLSKLNPNPVLTNKGKEFLDSLSNYKKEKIVVDDDNYIRYIDKSNEVIIERGIKGKCGHYGIYLKGVSKLEGEMIGFYLFKNDVNNACGYHVEDDKGTIKIIHTCCC